MTTRHVIPAANCIKTEFGYIVNATDGTTARWETFSHDWHHLKTEISRHNEHIVHDGRHETIYSTTGAMPILKSRQPSTKPLISILTIKD